MDDALTKDHTANREKRPAFLRLQLLSKIDTVLRREIAHDSFISKGINTLHNWLVQMPDETYPNKKIVMTVL